MKYGIVTPAWAALLLAMSFAIPQAPTSSTAGAPLQAAPSGGCFGYNEVNDSSIPAVAGSLRIALIKPVLTSTPYSQYQRGSFYAFYAKESGVTGNVTTDLGLLSTNVSSGYAYNQGWGLSAGMYGFFQSQTAVNCGLVLGKNVQVLTDMDVANGALFDSQSHAAKFDVVVLPFTEYVEGQEYVAYEEFVAGGGTLVMMAHSLEYPVTYNATTNVETLVYAHNWANNGTYASHIACGSNSYVTSCPWAKNNTDWTGSNTCMASCFHTYVYNGSVVNRGDPIGKRLYAEFGGTVFKSYGSHEENSVTNMTDTSIVSVFVNDSRNLIAAYTHQFRKGLVVCFGVFGDDIIATDPSAQYFLLQGVVLGRPTPTGTESSTEASETASGSSSASASASLTPSSPSTTSALVPVATSPPISFALVGVAVVVVAAVVVGALLRRRRAPP